MHGPPSVMMPPLGAEMLEPAAPGVNARPPEAAKLNWLAATTVAGAPPPITAMLPLVAAMLMVPAVTFANAVEPAPPAMRIEPLETPLSKSGSMDAEPAAPASTSMGPLSVLTSMVPVVGVPARSFDAAAAVAPPWMVKPPTTMVWSPPDPTSDSPRAVTSPICIFPALK